MQTTNTKDGRYKSAKKSATVLQSNRAFLSSKQTFLSVDKARQLRQSGDLRLSRLDREDYRRVEFVDLQ